MGLHRCTVRIPMFTQVPEDVVTNTLYVNTSLGAMTPAEMVELTSNVNALYNTAFAGGMMSPVMVSSGARLLVYNMSDTEPRTPLYDQSLSLNGTIEGTTGYVEEAAAVLSFQADRVSGLPQARRRGRLYLGCLSSSAIAPGGATQFTSLISTFRNQIAAAATTFLAANFADGIPWVVYSRTGGNWVDVDNGWIDVNPDTQRRRGQRAPQRTVW